MSTPEPQADARSYVTEIWCPPADNGVHVLHSHMREPEPLAEPGPEAEAGEAGYPTPALPEGDPWAPAVNQARAEVEAARPDAYLADNPHAGLEPEAEL